MTFAEVPLALPVRNISDLPTTPPGKAYHVGKTFVYLRGEQLFIFCLEDQILRLTYPFQPYVTLPFHGWELAR